MITPSRPITYSTPGIKSGQAGDDSGFTLLELMVSLAMTAVIVILITGALRLGLRSVNAGGKKIDSSERVRASINLITSQVQSEVPLTFDDNGEKKYYFTGEKDSMQLASNYSLWSGLKGYVIAGYKVETAENGKFRLTVTEKVIGMENTRETLLLDALDSVYFEYFHKGPTDEIGSWTSMWTESLFLPEKIRLHLVKDNRDLSMIIPMRTSWPQQVQGQTQTQSSKPGLPPLPVK